MTCGERRGLSIWSLTFSRPRIGAYALHAPSPKFQRQVRESCVLTEGWPALPAGSHAHAGVRIARNEVDMFYRLKSSDMHAASVSRRVSALLLARGMRACLSGAPGRR